MGSHLRYKLDITDEKGGLMVFLKTSNIQDIPLEVNFRKKWLVESIYKVLSQEIKYFICYLTNL